MKKTVSELKAEISDLWNQLNADSQDEIVLKIKAIEQEINDTRIFDKLKSTNAEQSRLRELALLAWNAEQPTEDITTNSGQFHASKIKKYPNLAALPYCTAEFQDGQIKELRINGIRFYMVRTEYVSGQPTKYTRPETFSDFLKLNSITEQDMQLSDFKKMIAEIEQINAEFKEAVKKFDSQKTSLSMYFYSHIGLFKQQNAGHIYEYSANLY
jgi:hypothetical protein